jgi:hypothetical protein
MQDFEAHCSQNREDWLRLLVAYAQAEAAVSVVEAALTKVAAPPADSAAVGPDADAEESATGWVSRVASIEGVEAACMSILHGRVIALGYLKFKLIDRQVGLRYRLTPSGRQLAQARPETTEAAA